jgi:ABC-type hemin transport system ATPase subunit
MTSDRELGPLLAAVRSECREAGVDDTLTAALDRLQVDSTSHSSSPIAGKVKAGKSTLLNALVGEQLAPTDAASARASSPGTATARRTAWSPTLDDGTQRQLSFRRDDGALEVDLAGASGAGRTARRRLAVVTARRPR